MALINQGGVQSASYGNKTQILANALNHHAVPIVVSDTGSVTEGGKKKLKAGMPMVGDLSSRLTPFTAVNVGTDDADVQGVLVHDVEFPTGATTANGALLIFGFVNENRIDSATAAKYSADVRAAIPLVKIYKAD